MRIFLITALLCAFSLASFGQQSGTPCEEAIYQKGGFESLTPEHRLEAMTAHLNSLIPEANFTQQSLLNDMINGLTVAHYTEGNILPPPVSVETAKQAWGTGYYDAFGLLGKEGMDVVDLYRQVPTDPNPIPCSCRFDSDCGRRSFCPDFSDCRQSWFGCGFLWLDPCLSLCSWL